MTDIVNVPMYIPILASVAILVVPGIVIESYWWWKDRSRNEALLPGGEERPAHDLPSGEGDRSRAA